MYCCFMIKLCSHWSWNCIVCFLIYFTILIGYYKNKTIPDVSMPFYGHCLLRMLIYHYLSRFWTFVYSDFQEKKQWINMTMYVRMWKCFFKWSSRCLLSIWPMHYAKMHRWLRYYYYNAHYVHYFFRSTLHQTVACRI